MTDARTFTALAFIVICSAFIGPKLDEAVDSYENTTEAHQEAQRLARYEKAVQEICGGENAVVQHLADGHIQCKTKRGYVTRRI